ncbi:MAG: hypothetical protein ABIH92_04625, partial [Nanoarchaeota archaeon]
MRIRYSLPIFLFFVLVMLAYVLAVEPNGASVTEISSETTPSGTAGNHSAIAGNVTEIVIFSEDSVTQSWQGYYGNVSGGLRIADASDSALYNWSLASPQGEVYASTNSSITWANIQCFNFTAAGNHTTSGEPAGNTSLYGTNLTQLQDSFNIDATDLDSVNATFSNFNHDAFFAANHEFTANECRSVQLFTNESASEDGVFEEVLLYEPVTTSVIFVSILEDSQKGFDDSNIDFEMLVLEDGHDSDTASTTYL